MILLDTNVVLWLAFEQHKLSAGARKAIDEARRAHEGLAISCITLLEIAMLVSKGRIHLNATLESFLSELETLFVVLPMTSRSCARMLQLPAIYPNDPADRLIGATALVEGLSLLTADRAIRRSKAVPTIW
ncbi:MAG TPA: type II toxin-antitoxin system VapC family toxin [Candidatus Acidoferrum sp.]|nr:type II toxin-antitoxin system VapC family toxin [Candidatus Acidoferrum sp.]